MPPTCISRKNLQSTLECVESFDKPKCHLEQYPTSAHVAVTVHCKACASLILAVVPESCRLELGYWVPGFEVDMDAVACFQQNMDLLDMKNDCIDVIPCDVTRLVRAGDENRQVFDTVILNPPFGTNQVNSGMDMQFLKVALSIARSHVYSMHKTTTRNHVLRTIKASGAKTEVVAELRFDIPRLYKKHRQDSVDVKVDFIHSWY